jgi:carboxypeptidase family protein
MRLQVTRITRGIVAIVCCAGVTIAGAQVPGSPTPGAVAQAPRTGAEGPGTAQIRGRVFDAETAKPMRSAQVRIYSADSRENRVSTTDEQGRYAFTELPAGRYNVFASKGGYVGVAYGQTRPFESGRPLDVRDTQTLEKVDFSLPRGGVITGHILDEYGDPAPNVQVTAMRYSFIQGQKRLTAYGHVDTTDDLGEFRLYGLTPGPYYVSATPRPTPGLAPNSEDREGYAATYYPGSTNPSEAQRVTVGAGQARADMNFALVPTRTVSISGTAVDSKGRPMMGGVTAFQNDVTFFSPVNGPLRPDGSFTIAGLSPGGYQLRAQGATTSDGLREVATAQVTIGGDDIADLRLVGDAPVTASGRIMFDPPGTSSILPSAFRVAVMAIPTSVVYISFGMAPPAPVQDDWTFAAKATPGRNRLFVSTPPGWSTKAVRVNGIDVTDTGIDIKRNQDVSGIEIELTNHPASVSGTVTNSHGEAAKDYTVVVFARDEQRWMPATRYIMASRPDQEGRFKISAAPPGDYLAIAFEYVESGQWTDPEFLKQIRDRATAFTLGDGEAKILSLKLIAQP